MESQMARISYEQETYRNAVMKAKLQARSVPDLQACKEEAIDTGTPLAWLIALAKSGRRPDLCI
jgi:hypothetical protein